MNRRINLTGKNSNDIYFVAYPKNLLYFMRYDFNLFMERCIDLCKLYMKTGDYKQEEAAEIRNSISGCHKYFEQNLRGAFEKIVIDCWIEYICRQNEIGVVTLWNNYIPCRNDFERAVFVRLSEYRHGHAINQWVNVLKVQEYANTKVDFIFGGRLKGSGEASARSNYFDLMFNVVANELGYDMESISGNKVYTMGRTPNSPFVMSSVSREIVRNLLSDLKYEEKVKSGKSDIVSDQTAMDAFGSMKAFLPSREDNIVETMIKSLSEVPAKVYMPAGLKAAVDLEIDVIIESGAYLQKCGLCKDYYMRSDEYDYDYCDKLSRSGRSCLEIMQKKKGPVIAEKENKIIHESIDAALLNERCDRLYKEMSARINVEFTQRDFSNWCGYMSTIRDNVISGEATLRDFENFVEYSRSINFLPQGISGNSEGDRREVKDNRGRTVKPFVFERVDRKEVSKADGKPEQYEYEEEEELPAPISSRVSSRVIRGVIPKAYSPGVTIPHGDETLRADKVEAAGIREEFGFAEAEEDVRIYSVKEKEPPQEYVKVFEPKKPSRSQTHAREEAPVSKNRYDIPEKQRIPAFSQASSARTERSERLPERTENPAELYEKRPESYERIIERAFPSEKEKAKSAPPAISLKPQKSQEKKEPEKSAYSIPAVSRIYASQRNEETQEIGFTDILRGFERKDGFTENIPTDADGVPVSHKTKRVMDAIFKQPKTNLFINANNKDEE